MGPRAPGAAHGALLLSAVLATSAFGYGFQAVPVLALLNQALCLCGLLSARHVWQLGLLWLAEALGLWVGFLHAFGDSLASVMTMLGFTALLTLVLGLALVPPLRALPARYEAFSERGAGPLVFPVTVTAFFAVAAAIAPMGSWGNPAYSVMLSSSSGPSQLAALFGLDCVNFCLSWASSLLTTFWLMPTARRVLALPRPEDVAAGDAGGLDSASELSPSHGGFASSSPAGVAVGGGASAGTPLLGGATGEQQQQQQHGALHIRHFFGLLAGCLALLGARPLGQYGRFFQTDIVSWRRDTVDAVCLVGYGDRATPEQRLNTTRRVLGQELFFGRDGLLPRRAQLLVWSEEAVTLAAGEQEEDFLNELGSLAREYGAVIGVGYSRLINAPTGEASSGSSDVYASDNMFALLHANGSRAFTYQKMHPVPGIERDVRPGQRIAPVVATAVGRISAAICFDLAFPNLIARAAGQGAGAELFIQPGWDWGPVATLHARMSAARAVEQGMTLFRCSSGGVSGVYGPFGDVIVEQITGTDQHAAPGAASDSAGFAVSFPRPERHLTFYQVFGSALSNVCIVAWLLMLVALLLPQETVYNNESLMRWLRPRSTSL
jgi:predicted amidohydrolase